MKGGTGIHFHAISSLLKLFKKSHGKPGKVGSGDLEHQSKNISKVISISKEYVEHSTPP
jgi:hypothetical protein